MALPLPQSASPPPLKAGPGAPLEPQVAAASPAAAAPLLLLSPGLSPHLAPPPPTLALLDLAPFIGWFSSTSRGSVVLCSFLTLFLVSLLDLQFRRCRAVGVALPVDRGWSLSFEPLPSPSRSLLTIAGTVWSGPRRREEQQRITFPHGAFSSST